MIPDIQKRERVLQHLIEVVTGIGTTGRCNRTPFTRTVFVRHNSRVGGVKTS